MQRRSSRSSRSGARRLCRLTASGPGASSQAVHGRQAERRRSRLRASASPTRSRLPTAPRADRALRPLCDRRRLCRRDDAAGDLAQPSHVAAGPACRSAAASASSIRRRSRSATASSSARRPISRAGTTAPASSATTSGSARRPISTRATWSSRISSAGGRAPRSSGQPTPACRPMCRSCSTDLEIKPVRHRRLGRYRHQRHDPARRDHRQGRDRRRRRRGDADVEPFSIVAGVPAKFLRWRTDSELVRAAEQKSGTLQ